MEFSPRHEPYSDELAQLASQCRVAIEQASDFYGLIHVEGTVTAPGSNTLELTEGEADHEDVAAVQLQAERNIARCVVAGADAPELIADAADSYYVSDDVTYESRGGHIGVQHIRRIVDDHDAGELVTVTTIEVPSEGGEESLHAALYSREGQVVRAEIVAIPAAEQAYFDACSDMFGDEARATQLFQGVFSDETELDVALQGLRSSALEVGVYPEDAIDLMLSHIRRNALAVKQDRDQAEGLRPERLERLQRLAGALSDTGV